MDLIDSVRLIIQLFLLPCKPRFCLIYFLARGLFKQSLFGRLQLCIFTESLLLTLSLPEVAKVNFPNFQSGKGQKKNVHVARERSVKEVSFKWSYHRMSSTDSKASTT